MDDLSIPTETAIYYSKKDAVFNLIIACGILLAGIYAGVFNKSYLIVLPFAVISGYLVFSSIRQYKNAEVQILINEKGIKTAATSFYPWEEIGH